MYIIKLICINQTNLYNLNYGQVVWISDVFGLEKKFVKDQKFAYHFISLTRVQSIVKKIQQNHIFHPIIIKTYK